VVIKHLSLGVKDPKRAADAVAELSKGNVESFHPVKGAYVCLWPDWRGQFVEFYPKEIQLLPTAEGAEFQSVRNTSEFSSTHINLETDLTGDEVETIAGRYGYHHFFRPGDGGPRHEVWIENTLLIELVTKDLRQREQVGG
jgi:hypothetical protein